MNGQAEDAILIPRAFWSAGIAAGVGVTDFAVWAALLSEADPETGETDASVRRLALITGLSPNAVQRAKAALCAGRLLVETRRDGQRVFLRPVCPMPAGEPKWPTPRKKSKIGGDLRRRVHERDAYRCVACGSHHELCCDHVVPESRGGETTFENLRTMCGPCNRRKGARLPDTIPDALAA